MSRLRICVLAVLVAALSGCGDATDDADGVAGEGGEDVGVPGPLLEHLARRLDEVPLGGDAGEAHPGALATEDGG